MARFTVELQPNEREALLRLSQGERRDPRQQAALLIVDGLQRAGLLPCDQAANSVPQPRYPRKKVRLAESSAAAPIEQRQHVVQRQGEEKNVDAR
jgi:hypothetical protein